MIFIAIGFAITFTSRALTRLPFLIAANSLHKTLKYKDTFTYKHMFLYCGDTSIFTYNRHTCTVYRRLLWW